MLACTLLGEVTYPIQHKPDKKKKKKLMKDLIGFCYQQDIEEGLAGVIPTEEAIDILTKSYKSSDNYLQVRSQVAEICKAQVSRQTKLFDYFHTL